MTYFLYPTLQASQLKTFLEEHRASDACIQKALTDVRIVNPSASLPAVSADVNCISRLLEPGMDGDAERTAASVDWFDDTCETNGISNMYCDVSVLVNTDHWKMSNDTKNKYRSVDFGKKKKTNRFLEFLTSLLRHTRERLIPKCMNRNAMH